MRITHEWNEETTLIRVEGLRQAVKALHVADVHLGIIDDRDEEFIDIHRELAVRFQERHDNRDPHGQIIP